MKREDVLGSEDQRPLSLHQAMRTFPPVAVAGPGRGGAGFQLKQLYSPAGCSVFIAFRFRGGCPPPLPVNPG